MGKVLIIKDTKAIALRLEWKINLQDTQSLHFFLQLTLLMIQGKMIINPEDIRDTNHKTVDHTTALEI